MGCEDSNQVEEQAKKTVRKRGKVAIDGASAEELGSRIEASTKAEINRELSRAMYFKYRTSAM